MVPNIVDSGLQIKVAGTLCEGVVMGRVADARSGIQHRVQGRYHTLVGARHKQDLHLIRGEIACHLHQVGYGAASNSGGHAGAAQGKVCRGGGRRTGLDVPVLRSVEGRIVDLQV